MQNQMPVSGAIGVLGKAILKAAVDVGIPVRREVSQSIEGCRLFSISN
jgi:hypothetical protein